MKSIFRSWMRGFFGYFFLILGLLLDSPFSRVTLAAPIPQDAVFWVVYDDYLPGNGDRMMAEKLKSRIEALGFRALAYPSSFTPPLPLVKVQHPTVIINVPNPYSHFSLPPIPLRLGVLQECGYTPSESTPSLGLRHCRLTSLLEAASSREDELHEIFSSSFREEECEKGFQGLLLDQELMTRFQVDPSKSPLMKASAYQELTDETRAQLDPLLGLTPSSSPSEIASALTQNDLYFGYSHLIFSQQYFASVAEEFSKNSTRRPLVILTGGDFDTKFEQTFRAPSDQVQSEGSEGLMAMEGKSIPSSPSFSSSPVPPSSPASPVSSSSSPGSLHSLSLNSNSNPSVHAHSSLADSLSAHLSYLFSELWTPEVPIPSPDLSSSGDVSDLKQSPPQVTPASCFSPFFKWPTLTHVEPSEPALLRMQRVEHRDFKILLYLSSLALVTGDRSTEEALSAGVPFFYEVLLHKRGFANQLRRVSPPGLITLLKSHAEPVYSISTYDSLIRKGHFSTLFHRVGLIQSIQDLLLEEKTPQYSQFFKMMHQYNHFNDELLRTYLEKLFDQTEILPKIPESGFVLGQRYQITGTQLERYKISFSEGQSRDPALREKFRLSPQHQFDVSRYSEDRFIIALIQP